MLKLSRIKGMTTEAKIICAISAEISESLLSRAFFLKFIEFIITTIVFLLQHYKNLGIVNEEKK